MPKATHKILVVDENLSFPKLLKVTGDHEYHIELEEATSPQMGIRLLRNKKPPSIIWSNLKFANSDIDGQMFLKKCRKISPLSSRVLCGTRLSKSKMDSMIRSSAIHSYYANPDYESIPMLSAIKIGIEFHKIKLFEHFLDRLKLETISNLDKTLIPFLNIKKKTNWKVGLTRDWINFDDRSLELNQLFKLTQTILNKIPTTTSNLANFTNKLEEEKKNEKKIRILGKVRDRMAFIESFLIHSKICLKKSLNHVDETNIKIAETEDKIKRIKYTFLE